MFGYKFYESRSNNSLIYGYHPNLDASHFDTVQFRHSAISTQKRHFDTETLQKVSHFNTALDVSTHFLTNAYLSLFMGFHYMDFVLVDLKIP